MVVSVHPEEGRLRTKRLRDLKPEHIAVEREGSVEIGNLQMDMADPDAGRMVGRFAHPGLLEDYFEMRRVIRPSIERAPDPWIMTTSARPMARRWDSAAGQRVRSSFYKGLQGTQAKLAPTPRLPKPTPEGHF